MAAEYKKLFPQKGITKVLKEGLLLHFTEEDGTYYFTLKKGEEYVRSVSKIKDIEPEHLTQANLENLRI